MKAANVLLSVIFGLVITLAVMIFFLLSDLDGLVKTTIEAAATEALQTDVNIGQVTVELTKGRGEIEDLTIANPLGFDEPFFFKLNRVAVHFDPSSIDEDVYIIKELKIDGAKLILEHKGINNTNIHTLLDNLKQNSENHGDSNNRTPEPLFAINVLNITNTTMQMVSPEFKNRQLNLANVQRTHIGDRKNGLTRKQLAIAIFQPFLDEAKQSYDAVLKEAGIDKITSTVEATLNDDGGQPLDSLVSESE